MKETCLVTGATGFIGTHVVETLVAEGYRVRATDLPDALADDDREKGRFPSVLRGLGDQVEVVAADMTRPETLRGLLQGVDYVFHVAAIFSYSAPEELLQRVNVEGTRHLLDEVLRQTGDLKRFVLWGAGGVYGFREGPLDEETTPSNPTNAYLRSKADQEELVRTYGREHKLSYAILRPTTVYGPRAVYGAGQLVLGTARQKLFVAPKNFTTSIPWIHVVDVARAALHVATSPECDGGTFNLVDESQMSTYQFWEFMSRLMGRPFVELPAIPMQTLRTVLKGVAVVGQTLGRRFGFKSPLEKDSVEYFGRSFDFQNARLKRTGFHFRYPDVKEGLRDTVQWYRKEGWL